MPAGHDTFPPPSPSVAERSKRLPSPKSPFGYTPAEISEITGYHANTVYQWLRSDDQNALKSNRHRRAHYVPPAVLREFLARFDGDAPADTTDGAELLATHRRMVAGHLANATLGTARQLLSVIEQANYAQVAVPADVHAAAAALSTWSGQLGTATEPTPGARLLTPVAS